MNSEELKVILKKKITGEKVAVRLFSALFITCAIFMTVNAKFDFTSKDYFLNTSLTVFMLVCLGVFAVLFTLFSLVEAPKIEKLILLLSYTVYAVQCTSQTDDIWFCLGACLILLLICFYVFGDEKSDPLSFNMPKPVTVSLIIAAGLYTASFISVQTVCRYLTQSTPNYDFGIFSQMFYYMKTTLQPLVTCERDMLLSHFAVHVSPIYYLFLPFYAIFPSPVTLMICQGVLLASGVIPLVLIAKHVGLSGKATVAFAAIYCLFPALSGGCYYDLHENKFLAPLLLWLFYFIEKNNWFGLIGFSLLVCLVKEDAPIYIVFVALYLIISKKSPLKGVVALCVSMAYFVTVLWLLEKYGQGVMTYRYNNFMFGEDAGLISVVKNVIKNPAYVIKQVFEADIDSNGSSKLIFMLQMLLPLGCMPFITKKFSRYILICPMILVNLMTDYVYQYSVFFQYTYGVIAFLMYASLLNYADMSVKTKRTLAVFAIGASIMVNTQTTYTRNYLKNYLANKENHDAVRIALSEIPEEASVKASTFLVASLSHHKELYDLKYEKKGRKTDYVVIDLRYSSEREAEKEYKNNDEYELVYKLDKWCAVYKLVEAEE